ncbi:hypothetical protein EG68_07684 [Paragonimus skrjabini miyazakii]|uniref:Uncharacterized protein n=1 Tax=Paragonimus skrjabini miyazakii TaxID=59628 RepID=A0A8S9YWU1_9TREM|nr:hypothetical protein EG68_07684 [Paragonimus skrjabini miyazakii]
MTFNKTMQPVLASRTAIPSIQLIVLILTVVNLTTMLTVILRMNNKPQNCKPRIAQYTTLIGGAILWFLALIYFISLVLFLFSLTVENFHKDPKLLGVRSVWPSKIYDMTFETLGTMFRIACGANIILFLSSMAFLMNSSLFGRPTFEKKTIQRIKL